MFEHMILQRIFPHRVYYWLNSKEDQRQVLFVSATQRQPLSICLIHIAPTLFSLLFKKLIRKINTLEI